MILGALFGVFLVLVALETPIAFALGLASLSYLLLEGRTPLVILVQRMTSGLDSFPFLALPLFVLAGLVFNQAGIARRIYDFTRAVAPFLIPMVVTLLLITSFPQLVLFLPGLFP